MNIIELTENELNNIIDLESYLGVYAWPSHSYEMGFRSRWKIYGGYVLNELKAVVVFQIIDNQCTLLNLVVGQDCVKKGMASSLLKFMLSEAAGCDSVFLEVRKDNKAAISLYTKFDFDVVNTRIGYYKYKGLKVDALEMALHIFPED